MKPPASIAQIPQGLVLTSLAKQSYNTASPRLRSKGIRHQVQPKRSLSAQQARRLHLASAQENVVFLDGHIPPPDLKFDAYVKRYSNSSPSDIAQRIRDATIVCTATCPLDRQTLQHAPNLRLVACLGTGSDHVNHAYLRERGISLCHVPSQNSDSVAEHALALHFGIQRQIVATDAAVRAGSHLVSRAVEHMAASQLRTCREHTAGIIGYGAVGQRLATLTRALGMRVLVAERKGSPTIRPGRTPFTSVLAQSTTLFLALPLTSSSRHTISHAELNLLAPHAATIVNVARADVVDAAAVAAALRSRRLAGYATDVLDDGGLGGLHRPLDQRTGGEGREQGEFVDDKVIATPHVAWLSTTSVARMREVLRGNLEGFVAGRPRNLLIDGRGVAASVADASANAIATV